MPPTSRPTIGDIAREAGVAAATVDRVLHDRPGVSQRMRSRVVEVAQRLGYLSADPGRTPPRPVRLAALLPAGTNAFIADLARHLGREAAAQAALSMRIERVEGLDGATLAARLLALSDTVDGVALVGVDHPSLRDAITRAAADGVRVVTLATDLPGTPRLGYVGIDNGQAGRLAGYVLGRLLGPRPRGRVALFAGTLSYRGHQEREMGFRQVLAEDFPGLEILALRESREDRARAASETRRLLAEHPDLRAIYNAGGASLGIAEALEAAGRSREVVLLAHDATPDKVPHILNGTLDAVIDQGARAAAQEAVAMLAAAVRGTEHAPDPPRLQLLLRENLPSAWV